MQIIVTKSFKFAHGGHQVEAFDTSDDPRETTDECAELAIAEGWARKAHQTAPENRDAAHKRKVKSRE